MLRLTWRRLCCADPPAEQSLLNLPARSAVRATTPAGSSTTTRRAVAARRRPLERRQGVGQIEAVGRANAVVPRRDRGRVPWSREQVATSADASLARAPALLGRLAPHRGRR